MTLIDAIATRAVCAVVLASLVAAGCGADDPEVSTAGTPIRVVATTTQAADLARAAAGGRAEVTGLIPPNADPHDYELRPRDVQALADADVIIRSGGDLDEWLSESIESAGAQAPVVTLIDHVQRRTGGHGHEGDAEHEEESGHLEEDEVDPHWWHDPRNAIRALESIHPALAHADPANAAAYKRAAEAESREIEALDQAAAKCLRTVPSDSRKLVTTHDALGYFAERYGYEIVGAVIPSLSTQAQPSSADTSALVRTIQRERVRAIFAESAVDPKIEQAIAREAGARVGAGLFTDSLGAKGSPAATYLGAHSANVRAIVEGLTGSASTCTLPE